MDKESRKLQKRGLFIVLTKKEAKKTIREKNKKRAKEGKEPLSREEKIEIIEKIAKAKRREVAARSAVLVMGAFMGVAGTKLLEAPSNRGITKTENTIEIDAIKAEKDIVIDNTDESGKYCKRDIFVDGIKVDLNKQENEIKANLKEEINQLKTKNEVLTYIKDMYAKEYNEEHGTDITSKNISILKEIYDVTLKEDTSKNGDKIFRKEIESSQTYEKGIYVITIETPEGIKSETIARDSNDNCVRIYDSDEEVEKYDENTASKMGDIIMNGTDYGISIKEKSDWEARDQYRNRFINAITKYKQRVIDTIVKGNNKDNTNDGVEIVE